MSLLQYGHRRRGGGLDADQITTLEYAIGLHRTKGKAWYVDSQVTAGDGLSWASPLATVATAIDRASANDRIYVAPGHTETITAADGWNFDVAGLQVIGLGSGNARPQITFSSDTAADVEVDAANIRLANLIFICAIDAQTLMLDVNAADCAIEDCEFRGTSTTAQWTTGVDLNGGASNVCDRATIRRCKFTSITAGAANAIGIDAVVDALVIEDCHIDGDFSDAGIHNPSGAIGTNWLIRDNVVRNRQTGDHAIELVSASTGEAVDNRLFGDTQGVVFDPGSLFCAGNVESHAIDSVGGPSPYGGEFHPVLGYRVEKDEDVNTASNDNLFTVTGLVQITSWVGQVTNAINTSPTDYKLNIASGADLCAATDLSSAVVGYTFQLGNDSGATILAQSTAAVSVADSADQNSFPSGNRIIGRVGLGSTTLQSTRTAGAASDAIRHILHYWPMEAGARVVAAA